MKDIKKRQNPQYLFYILVIALLVLGFLIIRPFLTAVLGACIIAYIFYPLYEFVQRRIKNRNISAILAAIVIILLITIPMGLILNSMMKEALYFFPRVNQVIASGEFVPQECHDDSMICTLTNQVRTLVSDIQVKYYLQESVKRLKDYLLGGAYDMLVKIPKAVLDIFVMFFMVYYLFKEGPEMASKIKSLVPMEEKHKDKIFKQLSDITKGVIYGWVIVAAVQGALGGIGFFIFGIPSPVMWGIIMAFASLLPFIGCSIIWFPAAVMKIVEGITTNDPTGIWMGVGLMLYGTLLISTIDNIIRAKIISDKAKVHPVLILLGVMGGIAIFGFIGAVIGPVVLVVIVSILEMYQKEKEKKDA